MKKLILLFIFLFFTQNVFADNNYVIILDAGNPTQLSLFRYNQLSALPDIQLIFSDHDNIDLSSFADQPDPAGLALKNILDRANQKLSALNINPKSVTIDIYGTERMRSLSAEQQEGIYLSVACFIHQHYLFNLDHIETVYGKRLGLYYWLTINYLADHFKNSTTLGMLHVGDFDTEIAYETPKLQSSDTETLNINHQFHTIFSKPFSQLGLDKMRESMNKNSSANSCYPIGAPNSGNFNQSQCGLLYQNLIHAFHLPNQLPSTQFLTSSSVAQIFYFLSADIPDKDAYSARLYYVCNTPWNLMKKEYEGESEANLLKFCANAVFVEQLFYSSLQLQEPQLWITDKINQQKVDWPLGALLYMLVKADDKNSIHFRN